MTSNNAALPLTNAPEEQAALHTSGVTLTSNNAALPTDSQNLCIKAVKAYQQFLSEQNHGLNEAQAVHQLHLVNRLNELHIHLNKRVPFGAGLGGGSSDAATTLRACALWLAGEGSGGGADEGVDEGSERSADESYERGADAGSERGADEGALSKRGSYPELPRRTEKSNLTFGRLPSESELPRIATHLGSDVPFFLGSSVAFGQGRGEILTSMDPPKALKDKWLLIVTPDIHVSTQEAYAGVVPNSNHDKDLRGLVQNGSISEWALHLTNDFEPSIFERYPAIRDLKLGLLSEGAKFSQMSGSGSSVYGIFASQSDTHVAKKNVEAKWPTARMWDGPIDAAF